MALALTLVLASGLIQVSPVFFPLGQHVPYDDQQLPCDGHERLLRGHPAFEALILEGEPGPLAPGRGPCALHQHDPQETVPVRDLPSLDLAGAHLVAWPEAGPPDKGGGGREGGHVVTGLAEDAHRALRAHPRYGLQEFFLFLVVLLAYVLHTLEAFLPLPLVE